MNLDFPPELFREGILRPVKRPLNQSVDHQLPDDTSRTCLRTSRSSSFTDAGCRMDASLALGDLACQQSLPLAAEFRHSSLTMLPSSIRSIQLELEKEKELYIMHTQAAAKSFERISQLMDELQNLLGGHFGSLSRPESSHSTRDSPYSNLRSNASQVISEAPGTTTTTTTINDSIRDISATVKAKYFPRKPRCLMFSGGDNDDLMLTSSLDGSIQYSSMKRQAVLKRLLLPSLINRDCYAEFMCAAPPLDGFIISTVDASLSMGGNSTETDPGNLPSSLVFMRNKLLGDVHHRVLTPPGSPHQKAVSALSSYRYGGPLESSFRFLTGGLDKNICIWRVDETLSRVTTQEVHRTHTSAVQAMVQTSSSASIIWSGGADCRLVGWSMSESRPTLLHKFPSRISHLLANDYHPHGLLTTFCSLQDQLQLLDTRSPLGQTSITFGHRELSITSRYIRPAWSLNGNMVAMGTAVPESRASAINIWDIRFLGKSLAPMRSVEFAGEKRFLNCEFWPAGNVLVALASDGSANFVDFTTSP